MAVPATEDNRSGWTMEPLVAQKILSVDEGGHGWSSSRGGGGSVNGKVTGAPPPSQAGFESLMALAAVAVAEREAEFVKTESASDCSRTGEKVKLESEADQPPEPVAGKRRSGWCRKHSMDSNGMPNGSKRLSSDEAISEVHYQRRREKNREAAQLCRQKKKEQLTQLRLTVEQLTRDNQVMATRIDGLSSEKMRLHQRVSELTLFNKELELQVARLRIAASNGDESLAQSRQAQLRPRGYPMPLPSFMPPSSATTGIAVPSTTHGEHGESVGSHMPPSAATSTGQPMGFGAACVLGQSTPAAVTSTSSPYTSHPGCHSVSAPHPISPSPFPILAKQPIAGSLTQPNGQTAQPIGSQAPGLKSSQ